MLKSKSPKMFKELQIEAIAYVLLTLIMALCWENSWFVTISLFVIYIVAMFTWERRPYDITVYLAGFFLAPLIDLNAIPAGAWSYGNPDAYNIPFWLFTGYSLGILLLVRMGETVYRILEGNYETNQIKTKETRDVKRGTLELAGSFIVHFLLILAIVKLWHIPVAVTAIYISVFFLQKLFWKKHPYDNYVFFAALVGSAILEWICVFYDSWTYPNPIILNIPLYIPFAYALGIYNMFKIHNSYERIVSKRN